jgi:hypothetical protein
MLVVYVDGTGVRVTPPGTVLALPMPVRGVREMAVLCAGSFLAVDQEGKLFVGRDSAAEEVRVIGDMAVMKVSCLCKASRGRAAFF